MFENIKANAHTRTPILFSESTMRQFKEVAWQNGMGDPATEDVAAARQKIIDADTAKREKRWKKTQALNRLFALGTV